MSRFRVHSFILSFLLIALVGVLPLALFVALDLTPAPARANEAARVAGELDRLLQLRLNETFTLAALPSLRAFAASDVAGRAQRATVALDELQAWVAADPPVREVFVVDASGVAILSTSDDWNQDWSARAFVKHALAGQPDICAVARDANEYSTYYAAPVLDNRGQVAGALVARIAAQELWAPVYEASGVDGAYAVLVDEDGVRLADGGTPARNLVALAPLSTAAQTRIVQEQTYGAQVTIIRTDGYPRAAQLIRSGEISSLKPEDLGVSQLAASRLAYKPWTVLAITPTPDLAGLFGWLALPLGIIVLGAAAAAWVLDR